ncbi:hypothetical protein DFH07DRAFT_866891 [Mycena maculata]|uniref:Ubiquitin carboxyl-terminal hydrolase n=1 Tax=Mycena maculata TaxID=230809 RepID=A0AAD7NMP4_9AGAR|nr:hypothetical protein DFH07DRAFT_866891 [Mycena maculata]
MSRWIPLESNPEVLNSWSTKAGLNPDSDSVQFDDVYGLDDSLLGMVMQPVKAVILLFPISPESEARRKQEDEEILAKGQPALDPTIFWIKQTISNACGTIGIIHALANTRKSSSDRDTLDPTMGLAKFIDQCTVLETTPLFADIHAQAASSGQSAVPTNLDTDLHFTCFVSRGKRLIELDGRRAGPIDRGECADLLKDAAKVIQEVYIGNSQSMNFNVMSLGPISSH